MSKLEELIEQYCPDGVEWHPFFDVCDLIRGITYNKEQEAKTQADDAYKVLRANNITLHLNILNFEDVKLVSKDVMVKPTQHLFAGDILMCAGSGSKEHVGKVAFIPENMDYTFGGFMAVVRCKDAILPRFVYHILTSGYFSNHLDVQINSSTINNINKQVMQSFEIPVPPLPVQEEIVRILDAFTELQAELQAELQKRLQQNNYYRDNLLSFEGRTDVQWKKLGDVADLLSGFPFDSSLFADNGIKLMRGVNIKRGQLCFNKTDDRYWESEKGLEKYIVNENDIVISMDGSLVGRSFGMVKKEHLPLLLVQRVARIRSSSANINYIYYCICNWFPDYVDKKKTQGAIPHISLKDIANFPIPFPSLLEQQKMVEILNHFDTLTNDLTSGLPAEIEKRRQQYEYYRDKLLTFKRKGA